MEPAKNVIDKRRDYIDSIRRLNYAVAQNETPSSAVAEYERKAESERRRRSERAPAERS